MDKYNVDWFPTLELGHDKLDVAAVYAASERASEREARLKERNKRVIDIQSSISTSGSTLASTLTTNSTSTSTFTTTSTSTSTNSTYTFITNPTYILTNSTLTSTSTTTEQSSHSSHNSNSLLIDRAVKTADSETQTPRPPKLCNKAVQTDDDNYFCENNIMSDDAMVQYYTGLATGLLLLKTFELVMGSFALGEKRSYYWRSFMIVLIKLRLNLGLQDIAYRLGICISTVCRRFHEMLDIMSCRLEWLIKWPEREELWKTTPSCFQATYGTKVVAIIDCFEIKIETPSHLVAKSSTWSQYKHANTAKVFIAMCPQGVTSFISPAWGGRVSDKFLTVNSGFLNKLLPGDCVLADRGFDIAEDVARVQATLYIPSFTRGCSQLSPVDVEATRKLANVRIHIERVIGATRQRYSILMSCIPIDFLKPKRPGDKPPIDKYIYKIILVCSALNNLCVSVVPVE